MTDLLLGKLVSFFLINDSFNDILRSESFKRAFENGHFIFVFVRKGFK